jgi:hypothetical protein
VSGGQRSPSDLAAAAYEAIRALNRATLPGQCELADQHDVYTVLANLAALLHITPQALRQTAGWLAREQQAGRVDVVDGEHAGQPADAVAAIQTALRFAGPWIAQAARHVDDAHQGAAHLVTGTPCTEQIGM